jgi:hypothetical protein
VNIPNSNSADLEDECANYEAKIKSYGGIDLFLAGTYRYFKDIEANNLNPEILLR